MHKDAYAQYPEAVRPPQFPPPPKPPRKPLRWLLYVLSAVACIGIGYAAAMNTPHVTPSESPVTVTAGASAPVAAATAGVTPPPAPAPAVACSASACLGAGIYRVGPGGIEPGRYSTEGAGHCYIARLKDDSGDFESIKSNNNLDGPASVTVQSGEFFEIRGTCTFRKS